jgi:hypothetical protein
MLHIETDEIMDIEKQNALHIIISLMNTYDITLHNIRERCEIAHGRSLEHLKIALVD